MKLLLDTTVLIDVLRGNKGAAAFLSDALVEGDELWSVSVVRTEVMAGMRRGEEKVTRDFLDSIAWLDVDVELADEAGHVARKFLKSHPGVDTVDYLVAAATVSLDGRLCTSNVRHFPMFAGLEAPYR